MNIPAEVRRKILEVLALAPRRRFSEPMLLDALTRLLPHPVTVEELHAAIERRHAEGLIDFKYNKDEERNEWFLTDSGLQKQGLNKFPNFEQATDRHG